MDREARIALMAWTDPPSFPWSVTSLTSMSPKRDEMASAIVPDLEPFEFSGWLLFLLLLLLLLLLPDALKIPNVGRLHLQKVDEDC